MTLEALYELVDRYGSSIIRENEINNTIKREITKIEAMYSEELNYLRSKMKSIEHEVSFMSDSDKTEFYKLLEKFEV